MTEVPPQGEQPAPPERPPPPPHRLVVTWGDLVVLFTLYVAGQLVVGLAMGGTEARDVAVGNLVGAGLALAVVAVVVWLRARRR